MEGDPFLTFKEVFKFIYLFDCAGVWLGHAGSSVVACELLIAACGM